MFAKVYKSSQMIPGLPITWILVSSFLLDIPHVFFDFGSCKNLRHDFLEVSCLVACTRSLFMLSDGMSSETTWGDSLPGSSAQ